MKPHYQSWGNYPLIYAKHIICPQHSDEIQTLNQYDDYVLPFGMGRSYGDCCLNKDGILLDTENLSGISFFDKNTGIIRCQAGTLLSDILPEVIPHGWFLPVLPGTKFVTVGGAIANDIHGKNHHSAGTFGCHVLKIELLRSDGEKITCSSGENHDFFRATIGGLGLTGLILWVDIQLKKIKSPFIRMESIRFSNIDEFFEIAYESDTNYEYTVAWIDCIVGGKKLGRGIFMRGNHADPSSDTLPKPPNSHLISVPFNAPRFFLNETTTQMFNICYYYKNFRKVSRSITYYEPFFFPLDSVLNWNRIYGKRGFFQYQCVIPHNTGKQTVIALLDKIVASKNASFLCVLKTFGEVFSPGMLSFPRPGITLALDFSNRGESTLDLFNELDQIVLDSKGALYPAKDARMPKQMFDSCFSDLSSFRKYIDPNFSSSLWRRVNNF